jgi:hypothetical protein
VRPAARAAAAAFGAAAILGAAWTCPAAAASTAPAAAPAVAAPAQAMPALMAATRPRVKYYIVPRSKSGAAQTLFRIAARTLGDGHRFMEIFNLNKGRLQPNGRRVESPNVIEPGWILRLPGDASGPGVHFGQMPNVRRHGIPPTPHGQTASPPAAANSPAGGGSALGEELAGGLLLLLAAAGLGVFLLRRRRGVGAGRRRAAHARPAGPHEDGWLGPPAPDPGDGGKRGRPRHHGGPGRYTDSFGPDGEPDWRDGGEPAAPTPAYNDWVPRPARQPAGRGAPVPAQRDWPHTPDHPSWPNTAIPDHPSWPSTPGGPLRPRREPAHALHHDTGWQAAPPMAPASGVRVATGPQRQRQAQQWAEPAVAADPGSQTYYDLALGDSRIQMVLTEPPPTAPGWGPGPQTGEMLVLPPQHPGQYAPPAGWDAEQYRIADSVRLAERTLADADSEADAIRHDAAIRAAAIREAAEQEAAQTRDEASADAVAVREAAEREIADLKQAAERQATAVREAAEQEAADLRASLLAMSAELTRVAGYVTENLATPLALPVSPAPARPSPVKRVPATAPDAAPEAAAPVAEPPTRTTTRPGTKPGARPARPATKPATRPAKKPAARPASQPTPKGRQLGAMRKMAAALVVALLVGIISGATEIAMHGFSFFMFRNAGAGAGNSQDLDENQGPGQRDAPGTHHHKAPVTNPGSKPATPN